MVWLPGPGNSSRVREKQRDFPLVWRQAKSLKFHVVLSLLFSSFPPTPNQSGSSKPMGLSALSPPPPAFHDWLHYSTCLAHPNKYGVHQPSLPQQHEWRRKRGRWWSDLLNWQLITETECQGIQMFLFIRMLEGNYTDSSRLVRQLSKAQDPSSYR